MGKASKQLRQELDKLRNRAARWGERHLEKVANCEPVFPAQFTDRQCDIAEPLFAVAEVLGDPWPQRIQKALGEVFAAPAAEDTSKRVLLFGHIRKIFLDERKDRLRTEDLITKLCAIQDAPWVEWNWGKNITPYGLARLLRDFEIRPRLIRDPEPCRGYNVNDFQDAFQRYLPPACNDCHEACNGSCNGSKSENSANAYATCNTVTDFYGGREQGGLNRSIEMRPELQNALLAARNLPAEDLPRLLGELEEIRATALARLSRPPAPAQDDGLLDVEETASRLGVSTDYVYRHHAEWPFTRRVGKKLLFSKVGLEKYLRTVKTA